MLRRVGRLIRVLFAVAGVAVAIWLPCSYQWVAHLHAIWPKRSVSVGSTGGYLLFQSAEVPIRSSIDLQTYPYFSVGPGSEKKLLDAGVVRASKRAPDVAWYHGMWPRFSRGPFGPFVLTSVRLPLWLLAAICLAWPVTSFIIHRRRHKRGFPIEPKGGGETVSPPVFSSS